MDPNTIISKALEYNVFLGILVFLVAAIIWFFYRERLKHEEETQRLLALIEAKNEKNSALQAKHNEDLMKIQLDMIQAMNNQTTAVRGVEMILQSLSKDVERIKDKG